MEGINDKFYIKLSTLTPLAVGDCSEKNLVNGVDFVIDKGYLYKLNLQKILDSGIDLFKLTTCFEKKEQLKEVIGNRIENVTDFKILLSSSLDINSFSNPVKVCVKNQLTGRPVVPGSSLKGAISSVLLGFFFKKDYSDSGMDKPDVNSIFGKPDDGTNFMRFIKFSDIEFDATSLVNTKIFNLWMDSGQWRGGWKNNKNETEKNIMINGFNTVYEVIPAQSSGIGAIMMSKMLYDRVNSKIKDNYASKKEKIMASVNHKLASLFRVINDHTKSYLEKERAFFEKFNAEDSDKIIDGIDSILDEIKRIMDEGNNSCVFKMSAGSGYHSITGDWHFDNYYSGRLNRRNEDQAKPKSRKIVIEDQRRSLMGFVKMSIADTSDVEVMELTRENERHEASHKYEEWKNQQKRCHLEQMLREEEKRESEKKLSDYRIKIEEANSCYYAGDKKQALSLYKEAGDILPDEADHNERIKEITRYFEAEKAQKEREAEAALAKERAISEGLSNLERKNCNDETKYLIDSFKQVNNAVERLLKKSKEQILREDQDKYLKITLSRIYKSNAKEQKMLSDFDSGEWKKLARYCGETRARNIFEDINKS